MPSPVVSIGTVVIEATPGSVERFAIRVFGLADKLALTTGIVVISLAIGGGLGIAARRDLRRAGFGFALFAALGVAAGLATGDDAHPALLPAAFAIAVGIALVVLDWLLDAADAVGTPDEVDDDERPGETAAYRPESLSDASRRRFLRLAASAGAAAVFAAAAGRMLVARSVPGIPAPPLPPPADPVAAPPPSAALDVDGLTPIVVSNDDFFRIDVNLVPPGVDASTWSLRIHGMVDDEVVLTYEELLDMRLVERYVTIACVSNEVGGTLVGNAAWTGVPLADLLERVGVHEGATQIVGRSVDGWTAGFPTDVALDGRDSMVAVAMNGEALPRTHGFPARLIIPGLYGYVSATKWLTEIELTTWEAFDAYWIPKGWSKEGPIKTQSRIDVPRGSVDAGLVTVAGVAWDPHVGIDEVEVSVDDGPWRTADLSEPLSEDAWRQWRLDWQATGGEHSLRVRATNGRGQVQTVERTAPAPDGATGYHTIRVTVRET